MSGRSATGRITSSHRPVPVQAAVRRQARAVADDKTHIIRAMSTPSTYGITTILDQEIMDLHSPMELYEMAYGGTADPFHGPIFQAEMISEIATTSDLIRDIDVQSSIYKCFNCGYTRIIVRQKQLSSGDESATTQYRCVKCGSTWFNTGRG